MAEPEKQSSEEPKKVPFTLALIAGGCAGTTVDVALYPLDTLKTRLQAEGGFWKAGGISKFGPKVKKIGILVGQKCTLGL